MTRLSDPGSGLPTASSRQHNIDIPTVAGFGAEWSAYDQSALAQNELESLFSSYFELFPWEHLAAGTMGIDAGCGSGRWARLVAPRVGRLLCIDASAAALGVAERNLSTLGNCDLVVGSVGAPPVHTGCLDFGYSLGVLHHVPNTAAALRACVATLKPGSPFLLYLYYRFDNRPAWFRALWRASNMLRRVISRLPFAARLWVTTGIAAFVYLPLARLSHLLEAVGLPVSGLPLSAYRSRSFYTMRTDALDRFGTRLEHRFTAAEIRRMMEEAGLESITFSQRVYWCAVGYRAQQDAGMRP